MSVCLFISLRKAETLSKKSVGFLPLDFTVSGNDIEQTANTYKIDYNQALFTLENPN
jgi:hypothetical protein